MVRTISSLCLAVLVAVAASGAAAQSGALTGTIAGRVTDAVTGEALPGATVVVVGTTLGAATDAEGRYTIDEVSAGTRVLRASFVGYEPAERTVTVSPRETVEVHFALAPDDNALDDVTVESSVEAAALRRSPFAVSTVDAQRLAGRGLTVDEAIARVAGVQVRRSGGLGSASVFSIRGLEGQRVQVYVDGVPTDFGGRAFTLDRIPLQLVDRVEVYKGIVPAEFGGDGLGSAVNLVIRRPEGGYLDASYTAGSFGQHQVSVFGQRPVGPTQIAASVNVDAAENDYVMDNPFQPGLVVRRDHDAVRRLAAGFSVEAPAPWFDEVEVEAALFATRQQIQGIQTRIQHALTKSDVGVVSVEAERKGAAGGRLDVRVTASAVGGRSSLVDTSAIRYEWDGTSRPNPNGRGEVGFFPSDSDNWTGLLDARVIATYQLGRGHELAGSLLAERTTFRPSNPIADEVAGRSVSGFPGENVSAVVGLSHTWTSPSNRLITVLGARGYAYRAEGTPSVLFNIGTPGEPVETRELIGGASGAVRYRLGGGVFVKGSVQLAQRLPTSQELFGDGLLIIAAPDLRPESAVNLSAGFLADVRFGTRRVQAEVTAFRSRLSDMIRLGPGLAGTAIYLNQGEARIVGIEAEVQGDLTSWLYARASATYQDARDVLATTPGTAAPNPTEGLRLPNLPYLYGGLSTEAYRDDLLGRDTRAKVFHEAYFTEEYFYAFEFSERQSRRIPRALTHTVGLEVAWLKTGLTLSAEVQNATDERVLNLFNQPLPGRSARFRVRYTLVGD
ncbi:MAG: TonB-dependent receptor [Bacteroidota bacterium]